MAAIDFPASPVVNQTFTSGNGVTYVWNGTLWLATAATSASQGNDFCAIQTSGFPSIPAGFTTLTPTPVITGNSGGWYSTSTGRFTPPAGRYMIYGSWSMTCSAASSFVSLLLRKNGTTLMRSEEMVPAANSTCENVVSGIVDASGTDWFDIQGASSAGSSTSYHMVFQAFPISGIKGPPGDPGAPGLNLIQTQNVLAASPVASLTFNIPSSVNNIQYYFRLRPVDNGVSLWMRTAGPSGTIDVGASDYLTTPGAIFGNSTVNGTQTTSSVLLLTPASNTTSNSPLWSVTGQGSWSDIQAPTGYRMGVFQSHSLEQAAVLTMMVNGGHMRLNALPITKLQFLFGSGNIAEGRVSVYGGQ